MIQALIVIKLENSSRKKVRNLCYNKNSTTMSLEKNGGRKRIIFGR
jgi:hypothetical protein